MSLRSQETSKRGQKPYTEHFNSLFNPPVSHQLPRTAICGTDVHIYDWNDWAVRTIPTPMVVGHEYCGIVKELGPSLTMLSI